MSAVLKMFALASLTVLLSLTAQTSANSIGVAISPLVAATEFGYEGDVAPEHWPAMFPTCGGQRQSPLNIVTSRTVNKAFPKLVMSGYDANVQSSVILNNGHTAQVSVSMANPARVSGGPLDDEYQLVQYHFHWGHDESTGSENLVDGRSYPLEMHMVHWNTKYDSFATAATRSDGLAVLGFFFDATGNDNDAFDFVTALTSVEFADSTTEFDGHPKLADLLPNSLKQYFTVQGSLTTPPCSEVVTWLNFRQTIKISRAQLRQFHTLMNHEGNEIEHNFRPTQALNGRVVYKNVGSD